MKRLLFLLPVLIYFSSCTLTITDSAHREKQYQDSIRIDSMIRYAQDTMRTYIIDSLTKVNPDLTKVSQYWDSFDLKMTEGTVVRGWPFDYAEHSMENRRSTENEYGIIVVQKDDGQLKFEEVSHNIYIVLKTGDVIR